MATKIYAADYRISGKLTVESTIASTSVSTGALVVAGGAGIDGKVTAKSATLTDTTASSSLATGALIVGGGIGASGQVSAQIFKAFGSGYDLTTSLDGTGAKISVNSAIRNMEFQTGATTRLTIDGAGPVTVAQELRVAGDVGGAASRNTLTGTSNLDANSTGVGTIKMKGATSRDSAAFIKFYIGTTAYYVPAFSAVTG
jgi:hypothetical protein